MSIISICLVLLLVGFVVYMVTSAPIPIDPWFKRLIVGVICFGVLIWLLNVVGIGTGLNLRLR